LDTGGNRLEAEQSWSTYEAAPRIDVGELLQLHTTLAVIEHRSASSTSSRSRGSNSQPVDCYRNVASADH